MLLFDEYNVQGMFDSKCDCFGTAAVGLGLSTFAAVSANMFLATTAMSFLSGSGDSGGGGGQQQQQQPYQQQQRQPEAIARQEAQIARADIAKTKKKVASLSGPAKPSTLLTGVGVDDEDLNVGSQGLTGNG